MINIQFFFCKKTDQLTLQFIGRNRFAGEITKHLMAVEGQFHLF